MPEYLEAASTTTPVAMRASLAPTQFTSLVFDGLGLAQAVDHYFDWMEGVGAYAKRRRTRANQGIPSPIDRESLLRGQTMHGDRGSEITARRNGDEILLRLVHRDDEIPEVCWYSVVRMRGMNAAPRRGVSIEHGTGRTIPPHLRLSPVAGAPSVLRELCQLDGVRPRLRDFLGSTTVPIRPGEADQFVRYVLLDRERTMPYVVVSARKSDGQFLIDPETISKRLATQAVVAVLQQDATWEFTEAFENSGYDRQVGVCFDGAVRLYHPNIDRSHSPREHYLWLPDRLQDFGYRATEAIAGEIAERVTWRAIPPRFFAIIDDFDRARSHRLVEELLQRETRESLDAQQKVVDLEALVSELREQLRRAQVEQALWQEEASSLENKAAEWHNLLEIAEQERNEAVRDRSVAQARIGALEARASGLTKRQLTALRGKLTRNEIGSLTHALVLLETVFADRVTVLTSAWKSAEEAEQFKKPDKAWGLMLQLVTDYWEAIQKGGGAVAKNVFTDATYGARESETVEGRDGARKRRTFEYDGKPVTMWEHLKIGVKDSTAETWRLHFFFDSETKKVVIGHCGKHLDFK